MLNVEITKWPVIIFASPRTGSSALGYDIAYNTGATYYNEPNFQPKELKEFIEYSKTNNNYILKLLGSSIPLYPIEIQTRIFSNDVFKIKISRKNIVDQIASHVISLSRKTWNYIEINEEYNNLQNTNIKISFDDIRRSINMINYDISIVDKINCDAVVYYEDIEKFESITQKTPRPANYNDLIDAINYLLNRARISNT